MGHSYDWHKFKLEPGVDRLSVKLLSKGRCCASCHAAVSWWNWAREEPGYEPLYLPVVPGVPKKGYTPRGWCHRVLGCVCTGPLTLYLLSVHRITARSLKQRMSSRNISKPRNKRSIKPGIEADFPCFSCLKGFSIYITGDIFLTFGVISSCFEWLVAVCVKVYIHIVCPSEPHNWWQTPQPELCFKSTI